MISLNKIVITGVTGFFGSALAKFLLSNGCKVYGVGRNKEKLNHLSRESSNGQFIPVVADFSEYSNLPMLISDDIDCFFHLAWSGGFTTAIRDYKVQMENAAHVGDAALAAISIGCKKFIYAGTYNQYEIQTILNGDNKEPRWTNIYSAGKTAGGVIARTLTYNAGIEYCGALIPMPYGEGNYSKQLMNIVIDQLLQGQSPKLVEGNNLYDIVYIDDIVRGLVAIGERGKNQSEYYLGHRKLKTFRELMIDVRDVIAPNIELKFGEYHDNQNIDYRKIDLDLLFRDTDFECSADFSRSLILTALWRKKIIGEKSDISFCL